VYPHLCYDSAMLRKNYIIYIPGLGDSKVSGQQKAVNLWRLHGVKAYLFQMRWDNGEAFEPKLERLLAHIDKAHSEGYEVSLVAASAGASAALNAFARRKDVIQGVVCICGQILGYNHVSGYTFKRNPAFGESMQMLKTSLEELTMDDRQRILSLHPVADPVVPVRDTRLPGSIEGRLPTTGHAISIGYAMTIGSRKIMRFLKRQKV
jgi:pimeloyl-ACP methyl ester carboxylesterase